LGGGTLPRRGLATIDGEGRRFGRTSSESSPRGALSRRLTACEPNRREGLAVGALLLYDFERYLMAGLIVLLPGPGWTVNLLRYGWRLRNPRYGRVVAAGVAVNVSTFLVVVMTTITVLYWDTIRSLPAG